MQKNHEKICEEDEEEAQEEENCVNEEHHHHSQKQIENREVSKEQKTDQINV